MYTGIVDDFCHMFADRRLRIDPQIVGVCIVQHDDLACRIRHDNTLISILQNLFQDALVHADFLQFPD